MPPIRQNIANLVSTCLLGTVFFGFYSYNYLKNTTNIPASLWANLSNVFYNRQKEFSDSDRLNEMYANSRTLKEAYSYMTSLFPEILFSKFLQSGEDIRRAQFVAMTLFMFKERIKDK